MELNTKIENKELEKIKSDFGFNTFKIPKNK